MADYTHLNLKTDVEDVAPNHGLSPNMEARYGRGPLELQPLDALRVPGSTRRGMEGGPDGAEILAFGAPNTENKDAQMLQDFWTD